MKDDISDVFSETEDTSETPEVEEEATAETKTEEAKEEESTVEDDATTTVAEQDEAESQEPEDPWTKHAYLDERGKRQKGDAKIADLEQQIRQLMSKDEKEDDTDYLSPSELKKRVDAEVDLKLKQVIFQDRLQRTYDETRGKYDDYPAMEKLFVELAGKDAALKAQFEASVNPPEFAYKHAKNHSLLNEYGGDVEKLIQAKLAEAKKEFGLTPEPEKEEPEKPSRPPSLANATESEKNSAPPKAPTTLSGLFADSQF